MTAVAAKWLSLIQVALTPKGLTPCAGFNHRANLRLDASLRKRLTIYTGYLPSHSTWAEAADCLTP